MSRKLIIDPVTRIEGHGKVTVHLDDDNNIVDARLHVVEFRGFEKFVQGHPFWEAPMLMQRICGICFVSHHLCGAKALDDMIGVGVKSGIGLRGRRRKSAVSATTRRCCNLMRRRTSTWSSPRCCSGWTPRPNSAISSA